jgi:PAS domain S-box-containing protein
VANDGAAGGEGRFGQMFRASPSAATLVRLSDNRFLELNEAFEELVGRTRAEMLGRTPEEIGLFVNPAEAHAMRARFLADGRLRGFPCVLRRSNGEERNVLFSSEGLEIDGEAVRLSILLDVTERDRAQAALAISEERFRQLAGAVQEAFWLSDVEKQRVLYVSPGYETIWGRPVARLASAPLDWLEAVHPDDRARVRKAAVEKQADGSYDEEYRILRPDGVVRWIHDRAFEVRVLVCVVRRVAFVGK